MIDTMGFLGVYKALYDYAPQAEGELEISEGDLLYVLEKSQEDDWWKAKKKASADEEDEPMGLIPNNYVEEVSETSGKWEYDIVATRRRSDARYTDHRDVLLGTSYRSRPRLVRVY